MLLPGGLNSENLLPLCVSCFKIQNAGREASGLMWEGVFEIRPHQDDTRCAISKSTSGYYRCGARCWADQIQPSDVLHFWPSWDEHWDGLLTHIYFYCLHQGSPTPRPGTGPSYGLLGTGPHSRKWAAGERARLHLHL